MSEINNTTAYPNTTPSLSDHVIGTDVSDTGNDANGETVTFTFQAIMDAFEANFAAPASAITSGTFANARIAKSSVTQHLATVADTGDYGDLSNKPTIPSVENTAYGAGWNGDTDAASKNAIYDEMENRATWTATINAQTGTAYTLDLADAKKRITCSNASAITVTVPTNASVAFATGAEIIITQIGAGQVTVTGDTGVTVNGTSAGSVAIQTQYQSVTLIKTATNTWVASGDI